MNKELTTQEQIALAKEILQVKNRRERSLKLGEILEREKLSVNDMYVLYNTLLTALCSLYSDLWYEIEDFIYEHFKDNEEAISYFQRVTD